MKIAVVGRGRLGGGLAELWERAGHQVRSHRSDSGDVSASDAVSLAVPGGSIAAAFESVQGLGARP